MFTFKSITNFGRHGSINSSEMVGKQVSWRANFYLLLTKMFEDNFNVPQENILKRLRSCTHTCHSLTKNIFVSFILAHCQKQPSPAHLHGRLSCNPLSGRESKAAVINRGDGRGAQWLRALAAFPGGLSLVPSTDIRQLTTTCHPSPTSSNVPYKTS